MVSNPIVWRLMHPNGQSAHCTLVSEAGRWQLRRWLNGFVANAEEFPDRDHAENRAAELRHGLEARGFRED